MKRLTLVFVSLLIVMSLGACGGGGGPQFPLRNRFQMLMAAINAKNLGQTMSHYSQSYMHDCSTWQDVQSGWNTIFNEPDYTLTLSDLVVTTEVFSNQTRDGLLVGTVTMTEDVSGVITTETWNINMPFKKEGSSWRLYGNQTCAASPANWRDALRSYLGAKESNR